MTTLWGGAQAQTPTAAQVMDPRAASAAGMPQREALLKAAEQALMRGETSSAILGFDRAAMMLHAADTEMGLVRAWMQAGDYRRALAFCAHTAGAHRDSPAASALYAWLLRVGGQGAFSQQLLHETLARSPDDKVATETRRALAAPSPRATGSLLELPHRMAPQTLMLDDQLPFPDGAQVVDSGVLLDGGLRALVPVSGVTGAQRVWVRNGLGQTTEAVIEPLPETHRMLGLTSLRLLSPLDAGEVQLAPHDPFAGSPGFAMAYAATPDAAADATPAWPWLHQGFLGAFSGQTGMRKLGIPLPVGARGGPVFDAAGRLAGMALRGGGDQHLMVPVSLFRDVLKQPSNSSEPLSPPGGSAGTRMPLDEGYERALKVSLQVIALP